MGLCYRSNKLSSSTVICDIGCSNYWKYIHIVVFYNELLFENSRYLLLLHTFYDHIQVETIKEHQVIECFHVFPELSLVLSEEVHNSLSRAQRFRAMMIVPPKNRFIAF